MPTANRVDVADETLTIKIGGDESNRKKKFKKKTNRIRSAKYTLLTFLPLNLVEQFRRIANFYFLVMCVISLMIDSPVLPVTSLLPLVFVISVTATKQGYEDFMRHKTDNIVNRSPVTVIRDGKVVDIRSEQIMQGDLVQVSKDCDIPCDLVILKSYDLHGKCYVTTANLDGETNLKILHIPRNLPPVPVDRLHTLGTIECEKPTSDLYSFNGKIILSPNYQRFTTVNDISSPSILASVLPLGAENLLLRGSRLKNTEWVIGCAVYIGQTTKLALNSKITRNKVASSEKYVNKFLIFLLVVLVCLVTFCYLYKRYYEMFVVGGHTYLGPATDKITVSQFLQDYLSFLMLFNYIIPISLYVTIEMHKFLGAFFLEWDTHLYDEVTNQPCIANTSDLNDDLGQVNILFSDKTGTLTKNEMCLQKVSINGHKYILKGTKLEDEVNKSKIDISKFQKHHFIFFQSLALCHTVQVIANPDDDEATERIQNVYDFYDIKEESRNNQPNQHETENDEIDFVHVAKTGASNNTDNNPLLKKSTSFIIADEIKSEPKLVKWRTPPGGRTPSTIPRDISNNRVHPSNEPSADNIERPVTYPNSFQRMPEGRSSNINFYRSTSHVDIQNSSTTQTHRRTQSYGAPSTSQRRIGVSTSNMREIASSLSSKQGYAMPTYTKESLLTRTESMRRKEVIKNVVEKLDYQASSPDEKALVEGCANLGVIYMGDDDEVLTLHVMPPHVNSVNTSYNPHVRRWTFKRLEVLEFSSDRKRMSVIVKDKNSDIWVYTKGAESFVFPLCRRDSSEIINITNNHINDYAKEGLRTLAIARRRLKYEEFKEFRNELIMANSSLQDRKQLVSQCYAKVERDLELIGATAVEDSLQDNVRETLQALQAAGIKIWVLTGDKIETAFNIALSCGHISESFAKYFITECKSKIEVTQHLKALEQEMSSLPNANFALLIDGKSLALALSCCSKEFRDISIKCKAVLCCRLSPLQKCEVVHLIKQTRKYITAAIGDGANDVSMIQEAHIGLGIVGKEGRQAARCADYAFSNFYMLKRILLVHGHYFSKRLAILVLYFFYKNIVFMGMGFLFQFDSMFSTTAIFDTLYLTLYNVVYTSLPILILSLTEKPYMEAVLLRNPELYLNNTYYKPLQWQYFIGWIAIGVYHAAIIYYISYITWNSNNAILSTSQPADLPCFGTILMHNVVILVNLKLLIEAKYRTHLLIGIIVGSILAFVLTTLIYNVITIFYDKTVYWTYLYLLSSISFWILSILTIITCLVPDIISLLPGDRARMLLNNRASQTINTGNNVESTNL